MTIRPASSTPQLTGEACGPPSFRVGITIALCRPLMNSVSSAALTTVDVAIFLATPANPTGWPEPDAVAGRCPGVQLMSIVRRFLQKPGTIELAPFQRLLPQVGAHEQRLRGLTDGELTAAAQAARDDAESCACCREAAWRARGERAY